MPALKIDATAFGTLSDERKADYRQNGDIYELILDGELESHSGVLSHISGLKTNSEALKSEKTALEQQIAEWKKLGKKPEEITALVQAAADAERKKQEAAGNYQELMQQAATKHEQDIAALAETHAKEKTFYERVIEKNLIDRAATEAIVAAGGNQQTVALLLPHVKAHLKALTEGDGDARDYVVRVMGANGKPRIKDAAGNFMQIGDLVTEMRTKPEYMIAFPPSGAGGGGAHNGGAQTRGNGKTMPRASFAQLDAAAQSKFCLEGGTITD
jgi:hypothetical protein